MVNQYSKGSKNHINVVFHKGGMPSKRAQPVMSLDQGEKALRVKWKLSEHLFTNKQATAQSIPKVSSRNTGYADTLGRIHQAGVTPIDKYYQGVPQVIALNRECTSNPVTKCWCVLTNEVVHYDDQDHIQFNSMYVRPSRLQRIVTSSPWAPSLWGLQNLGMSG
jgi:hypothetical protein